ncbi:alpha/beta hydrolase [Nonomuraea sp. SMC257]|uniref:Alpha/beta hydrolase n=1 Tax=Nonomuraea montanisoli TaxID=2741721 RepID=A0A7Y6I6G9_9ACTN|nr:alpha/beta hydrolase [Nonomuraea montanisoli]NUW32444.1 alpha/beta hydrolase [Nonomuraea montanisoli]
MANDHPSPARRRPVRLAAVAGLLALTASTFWAPAPAAAAAPSAPHLPEPTGPHRVGTTSLHLTDTSRPDPWVSTAKARELMVSLWYPTAARDGRRAPYVTLKESELLLKGSGIKELEKVPPDGLSRTRTNAFTGAEPAGRRRSLPLVVMSPGFTWPRSSLTSLAEDLASRGYVVASVDHTYENFATTFPDGRVTTCAACENINADGFGQKVIRNRAVDISFVLDQLTGPHPAWKGATLIDPARIAMAGQSIGGAAAPETMLKDARVRAGINMDGSMFLPIPESGLARPFMFMGAPSGDSTWERDWQHLAGWRRWLVVQGAVHPSFTDYDMLLQQLGVDLGGGLKGARSTDITRTYVEAFLDLHLRGKAQPLLDKPSRRYPEVRFCSPSMESCHERAALHGAG